VNYTDEEVPSERQMYLQGTSKLVSEL